MFADSAEGGIAVKYIFVTGGVVSGLGKGICAASLGRLLKQRGLRVRNQKFDPYLNIDPGTMSPYQHGEVFVTDDGAETDLDLGHYERFVTSGVRIGTPCATTRGLGVAEMDRIAACIYDAATNFDAKADEIRAAVAEICAAHPLYQ